MSPCETGDIPHEPTELTGGHSLLRERETRRVLECRAVLHSGSLRALTRIGKTLLADAAERISDGSGGPTIGDHLARNGSQTILRACIARCLTVRTAAGNKRHAHAPGIGLYTASASSPHDYLSLRPVAFSQDFP
jgi:hypothetical protein